MNSETKNEFDSLVGPVKMINRIVSFWPLERNIGSMQHYFRIFHRIVMFFFALFMCFAVTADGVHNKEDIEGVTECGLIGAAFYLVVLRLIIFSLYQEEMGFIVETMKDDWYEATSEERGVLKDKCGFSYKISKVFIFTVAAAMASFTLVPTIKIFFLGGGRERLPFRGYIYINHTITPIFETVLIINIAAGLFGCGTIAAATSFSLITIIHSAAKFAVLQKKLSSLKNNDPHVNQVVAECVIQHQESIKFAEVLEKVISPLALGQFLTSTGLICFAGFQITTNIADKERVMKYCMFLQSAVLELFLFSFSGNQLMKESELVGDSAYFSDWMGSSFAKSIQIMMMRSRNPCRITAAKFYDLSLESFSKVLSTSFSYFTVLDAVNGEEE